MSRVAGKIALVTGSAKGIGKAIATKLAKEGASVLVTDIDEKVGQETAKEIVKAGGTSSFMKLNAAKEDDWIASMKLIGSKWGHLDITVNNAGIAVLGTAEHLKLEAWHKCLTTDLDSTFLGTKHSIGLMKWRKSGTASIVNVASVAGLIGDPHLAAYSASKGGIRAFSRSAALHLAKSGIRVNTIFPGIVWSPMTQDAYDPRRAGGEQMRKYLESQYPLGHFGQAEDVAFGALYLASEESRFVTGSELVIDGGLTAQ